MSANQDRVDNLIPFYRNTAESTLQEELEENGIELNGEFLKDVGVVLLGLFTYAMCIVVPIICYHYLTN